MGGSDVNVPPPTQQEKDLQAQQAALLRQQTSILQAQQHQQQLLEPVLFQSLGITPTLDAHGNITGYTHQASPNETLQNQVTGQLLQRTSDALAGKLQVDPNLTTELDRQQNALNESLIKDFGSLTAARNSSAGAERLRQFDTFKTNLIASAQRGDLTTAEQLGIAGQNQQAQQVQQLLGGATGINAAGTNFAGLFGSNAAGFGVAQQPFLQQRQLQVQAAINNANQPSTFGTLLGLGGSLGAGALGNPSLF